MLTDEEVGRIADAVAERLKEDAVITHILEHEATGAGRVIDAAKAKATLCKCFTVEEDGFEACWSPGILGLMTSQRNPEQIAEFCAMGKELAGEGAKARFKKFRTAVKEAHKRWEEKGGGLPEWWEEIGRSLEEHKVEF